MKVDDERAEPTLVEDGLGLAAETSLLSVVTPLSLSVERILALLILRHLMQCVLPARLGHAQRLACFRDDDLHDEIIVRRERCWFVVGGTQTASMGMGTQGG